MGTDKYGLFRSRSRESGANERRRRHPCLSQGGPVRPGGLEALCGYAGLEFAWSRYCNPQEKQHESVTSTACIAAASACENRALTIPTTGEFASKLALFIVAVAALVLSPAFAQQHSAQRSPLLLACQYTVRMGKSWARLPKRVDTAAKRSTCRHGDVFQGPVLTSFSSTPMYLKSMLIALSRASFRWDRASR